MMDRKIVEYLVMGKPHRWIKEQLGVGAGRLAKVQTLAEAHGYLSGQAMPAYPQALFADRVDRRSEQRSDVDATLLARKEWIEERLCAGWKAITVFEELGLAVTRSSFYRFLERHGLDRLSREARVVRVVPEIVHRPGDALILDWGKLCTVIDPGSGVKRTLWVMIAVLGFSRYLCARVVWRNDVATTLAAIESIWQELGGVTSRLTSDNPKCFALTACRYEPVLNPAFERFAVHYGFTIECLPPRDPQKKGKIERMVPYVRRLYEAHGEFISLDESQQYLSNKLLIANQRRHGTTQRQPIDDLTVERTHLRTLPALAYEIEESTTSTVRQDGHVRFANRYYSLDERFIGEDVLILGSNTQLAIYHAGQLIETHQRLIDPYRVKQTKPQHLKPWERSLSEDSIYRQSARKLGPFVEQMIVIVLHQGQGFIDTRKVWGILCLDKEYAPEAINAACQRALDLKTHGYRAVRRFLKQSPKAKRSLAANPRSTPSYENESTVASEPSLVQYKYTRDLSVYSQQLALIPTRTHTPENDA
ncbi:MAG: IS21 family transposase [Tepidisphaeraceae bacterium]